MKINILLRKYEKRMADSITNYIEAMKTVVDLETSYNQRRNYDATTLRKFRNMDIAKPWELSFKNWITAMYPKFPWSEYLSVYLIVKELPDSVIKRLNIDSLKVLNRHPLSTNIKMVIPRLRKIKGIINKDDVLILLDEMKKNDEFPKEISNSKKSTLKNKIKNTIKEKKEITPIDQVQKLEQIIEAKNALLDALIEKGRATKKELVECRNIK